jgi:hypothetical protein
VKGRQQQQQHKKWGSNWFILLAERPVFLWFCAKTYDHKASWVIISVLGGTSQIYFIQQVFKELRSWM